MIDECQPKTDNKSQGVPTKSELMRDLLAVCAKLPERDVAKLLSDGQAYLEVRSGKRQKRNQRWRKI